MFGGILKVITFVPSAVRLVERLFTGRSGGEKQGAAVDIIIALLPLFGVGEDKEEASGELVEGITLAITAVVKILHAVGEFKHKD